MSVGYVVAIVLVVLDLTGTYRMSWWSIFLYLVLYAFALGATQACIAAVARRAKRKEIQRVIARQQGR